MTPPGRVNYSGLVIAGVGFFLTRFTVTLAVYEDPTRFYLAGVVPLVLGLGLAAFGVALAVADVESALVRTTAAWCLAGTGGMLVLVVLTLLGSTAASVDLATVRSQAYLSNFLIGGAVGGTLTGLYAARDRRQRGELRHQANRLEVLNRLLRHEVLNALTAIRGYATLTDGGSPKAQAVIREYSDAIEGTIEEVKYLTRSARLSDGRSGSVDLGDCLDASVETVRETHPGAEVSVQTPSEMPAVRANDRLDRVFTHLIENAAVYSADERAGSDGVPTVEVSVTVRANAVHVSVEDDGPGLPERQQRLLETGEVTRYDDPRAGYGLNVVRLLVESYRGSIETDVGPAGSTVTVVLPRADPEGPGVRSVGEGLTGVRPAAPHLVVTLGAAVVAGVVYGVLAELLGGSVGVIGVFYGVADPVVGWVTHEFHSVVFGFVFAGLVSLTPERYRDYLPAHVGLGLGWGLALWFVAAGLVAAVWLRLLGIPAPLPNLSATTLATHLAWGGSLGVLTALGYEYVTPWLARLDERRARGHGRD